MAGLESVPFQQVEHARAALAGELGAKIVGFAVQDGTDRLAGGFGFLHGLGEEPSGQLVVPLGQADGDLLGGALVELGRPARSWTGAAAAPFVDDVEERLVRQAVQMERRGLTCETEGGGGFVAADRLRLAHDVPVQPHPGRLVQCGDRGNVGTGRLLRVVHEHQCKTHGS